MSRVLSLVLAFAAWASSVWALLVGLVWGLGLKCDDSCSNGPGWREDPDAWQWNGLAALGGLAFIAGAALFAFVWWRRPVLAGLAAVVGLTSVYVMAGGFSSAWIDHLDRRSGFELLVLATGVFAPILAVLLTIRPRSSSGV